MCLEVCVNSELLKKEDERISKLEEAEQRFMDDVEEYDIWGRLDYIKDDYDKVARKHGVTRAFTEFLTEEW